MLRQSAFLSGLDSNLNKVRKTLGVVAGAFIVAAGISWLLEFLSRFHWLLGGIVAGVIHTPILRGRAPATP